MKESPDGYSPPAWAHHLLRLYCPDSLIEEIEGDLMEAFESNIKKRGVAFARQQYVIDVIRFFNPTTFRKARNIDLPSPYNRVNHLTMFRSNIKIAFRSFIKRPLYTTINVMGLSVGIAACLLIFQYVSNELNYDAFHENADRIYRVAVLEGRSGVSEERSAINYYGVGPAMRDALPEVSDFTTMHDRTALMFKGEESFRESRIFYVDSNFLQFFTYDMVEGDPATALAAPGAVVLTTKTVEKYFPDENPIGKTLNINKEEDLLVTGVVEARENTHVPFDFLVNNINYVNKRYRSRGTIWNWSNFLVYVLLEPGADPASVEAKLPGIISRYKQVDEGELSVHFLQPLQDIHLYSHLSWEVAPNGNGKVVHALLIVGLLILLIAWANYVNLSTAQATEWAKEVGVRKVAGATRRQLIGQFMSQSFLLNLFAVLLALGLVEFVKPFFARLTGDASMASLWEDPVFFGGFVAFFLLGVLLSGLYPSFVLSAFQPVKVLKSAFSTSRSGTLLRKGLTVFQFVASITLIVGTVVLYRQINFMQRQDLGFNPEQTLVVNGARFADSTYSNKYLSFKDELLGNQAIEKIAVSSSVPGKEMTATISGIRRKGRPESEGDLMQIFWVDSDFLPTYEMTLLAGRNFFQEDGEREGDAVIISRKALEMMGFDNAAHAIDQEIDIGTAGENRFRIVGVIEDYHHQSLKEKIAPVLLLNNPFNRNYYSLRISTDHLLETIALIRDKYQDFFPGNPLDHFFLDESFNAQYEAELRLGKVLVTFSGLAIFIACLGLFGLASFTVVQRTREIGIRKVLGASISSIVGLLSRDLLRLVLIALGIASPIAWFFMDQWLADFAYRIDIEWWTFALAGVAAILIAGLTVSFQTVKAALANPVETLRNE